MKEGFEIQCKVDEDNMLKNIGYLLLRLCQKKIFLWQNQAIRRGIAHLY